MKEIAVICWYLSIGEFNGYATAFELYKFLSQKYKINVVVPREEYIFSEEVRYINANMTVRNICVEATQKSAPEHWTFYRNLSKNITERDKDKLRKAVEGSDLIVCDSVYWVSLMRSIFPDRKIIFRSLDIEYDQELWLAKFHGKDISMSKKTSYEFEKRAYKDADFILPLTQEDANRIADLYQIDSSKFKVIPICSINADIISKYIPKKRVKGKVTKGVLINAHFLDHSEAILNRIAKIKDLEFHIVGKSFMHLATVPSNVILHGVISEKQKMDLLSSCDFALNITEITYGMNTKMSDYFSLGIPVLSNKLGTRGFNAVENVHYFPCTVETLDADIIKFCSLNTEERYRFALKAFENCCSYNNYRNYMQFFSENIDNEEKCCFIFGAKACGRSALSELEAGGYECIGFIDNDTSRHKEIYLGKTIYSFPEALEIIEKSLKKIKIVIAVSLPYLGEVYSQVSDYIEDDDILIAGTNYYSVMTTDIFDKERLKKYGGKS